MKESWQMIFPPGLYGPNDITVLTKIKSEFLAPTYCRWERRNRDPPKGIGVGYEQWIRLLVFEISDEGFFTSLFIIKTIRHSSNIIESKILHSSINLF